MPARPPCSKPLGHRPQSDCGEARPVPHYYYDPGVLQMQIDSLGLLDATTNQCRICGDVPPRAAIASWLASNAAIPRQGEPNTKVARELARAQRRFNKKGRTDG